MVMVVVELEVEVELQVEAEVEAYMVIAARRAGIVGFGGRRGKFFWSCLPKVICTRLAAMWN
jgi:hypothetical protein